MLSYLLAGGWGEVWMDHSPGCGAFSGYDGTCSWSTTRAPLLAAYGVPSSAMVASQPPTAQWRTSPSKMTR